VWVTEQWVSCWPAVWLGLAPDPANNPTRFAWAGLLPGADINPGFPCQGWNWTAVPSYGSFNLGGSFAAIKIFGANQIMTWAVHRLFSVHSSLSSCIQHRDATNILWVAVMSLQIRSENHMFSIMIQRTLFILQFWNCKVNVRLMIDNLCSDHVTIRLELRCLIRMHGLGLKCRLFHEKACSNALGRVFLCEDPLEQCSYGLKLELEQKW